MKIFYSFPLLLLLAVNSYSQTQKIPSSYFVTVVENDSLIKASVSNSKLKITPEKEKVYYWYSNNKIEFTQGGYSGKLLDGEITCSDKEGKLLWSGFFDKGIKNGEWKQWTNNGNLISITNYKSGLLNGESVYYSTDGKIILQGTYKNNKRECDWKSTDSNDIEATEKYKDGQLVTDEMKPKKVKGTTDKNTPEKEKHHFSFKNLFKPKNDKSK